MKIENYEKIKAIILITMAVVTVLAIGAGSLIRSSRVFKPQKGLGSVEEGTIEISDAFDSISVDMSVVEFDIQYGDTASIYYKVPQKLIPKMNVKEKTLEIKSIAGDVKRSEDLRNMASQNYQVTLTIPKNTDYVSIAISVNCGNINLEQIKAESISVDADLGQINIDGIECSDCAISAALGDINLNSAIAKNLVIDADCGNIVVDGIEADEVIADNSMGNIEIKQAKAEKGEFGLDMGNLTIDGDFDEITAGCSMGSIEITTDRPESQMKLDLDVDMGSARVNGKEWKN